MCGIVGAVSARNIVPILVQGLQRLEYRGYDSCGVAIHAASGGAAGPQAGLQRARSTARVADLLAQDSIPADQLSGLAELHQRVFVLMQSRHADLAHQLSSERQVSRIQRAYGG